MYGAGKKRVKIIILTIASKQIDGRSIAYKGRAAGRGDGGE